MFEGDPKPKPEEKPATAVDRVREMLEGNRDLITTEVYQASLVTLTAVQLAQQEIDKEKSQK